LRNSWRGDCINSKASYLCKKMLDAFDENHELKTYLLKRDYFADAMASKQGGFT